MFKGGLLATQYTPFTVADQLESVKYERIYKQRS